MTISLFAIRIFFAGVLAVVLCRAEREIVYPVVTVILGGLISAMVLDFTKRSSLSGPSGSVPRWHAARPRPYEYDEDDHGLPPPQSEEVSLLEKRHSSSGAVFDGGMAAAIDS